MGENGNGNVNIKIKKGKGNNRRVDAEPSIEVLREYHVSGNETKFERIISDLIFLSKLKTTQKINVSTKEIIGDSLPERAYRTYLQVEKKETTLKFVKKVIAEAIDQLYFFKSMKEPFYHQLADIIMEEIINAKKGILALAETYSEYDSISSDIEAIVKSINVKLQLTPIDRDN